MVLKVQVIQQICMSTISLMWGEFWEKKRRQAVDATETLLLGKSMIFKKKYVLHFLYKVSNFDTCSAHMSIFRGKEVASN